MHSKIDHWAVLLAAAALATVGAGAAVATAGAKTKPTPGGGTATACSAIAGNPTTKDAGALARVPCAPGLPDLRAAGGCDRTTIASHQTVSCTIEIHNDGSAPVTFSANATVARITFPTGFLIDGTGGILMCTLAADRTTADLCYAGDTTLAAGGVASAIVTVTVPSVSCISPAVSGDWVTRLDPDGAIAEADEANNTLTVGLTVNPVAC